MFDTHCHLTSSALRDRVDDVLADAKAAGVDGCITVSTTSEDCLTCADLTRQYANVWASAGVHPLYADQPVDWEKVQQAGENPKCVAWGELGLDNHYDKPDYSIQRQVLEQQLSHIEGWIAGGLDKPIIVHCRKSFDDLLAVFRGAPFDPGRYVFHCFTGSPDDARAVLDFGAWISFTGVVTFKNAPEVAEAARLVPADRIMVETDSPYLSPEPVRGVRPNEPKHVPHIARFLAELRDVEYGEFERQLDANACRYFGVSTQ